MKQEIHYGILKWYTRQERIDVIRCNDEQKSIRNIGRYKIYATEQGFKCVISMHYVWDEYNFPLTEHIVLVGKMNNALNYGHFEFSEDGKSLLFVVEVKCKAPFNGQAKFCYYSFLDRLGYYGYYLMDKYFEDEIMELTEER